MAIISFYLNEKYEKKLKDAAEEKRMSIPVYIRYKLFDESTIFSVDEIIKRIQNGKFEGKEFTVPDLYTDEEWLQIDKGNAGILSKNFCIYIAKNPGLGIRRVEGKNIKRRTVYIYMKG